MMKQIGKAIVYALAAIGAFVVYLVIQGSTETDSED